MKTLIIYHSRFGGTEECARRLAAHIGADAYIQNLSQLTPEAIEKAEAVIIGASVDKGRLVRPMASFLAEHPEIGMRQPLGLFLCHGEPDGGRLLRSCYPSALLSRARVAEAVGGRLDLEKVPKLLRRILGWIGVKESYDRIDTAALSRLAEVFK
jgi:hypothetical protein